MLAGLRWIGLLAAAGIGIVPLAAHAPQPIQAEPAIDGPDIIVIARQLRKVRIHYATNGRWVRSCDIAISSGDQRIDRIMCAILRACVKSGQYEVDTAKACIAGRIDSLDAAAEEAMLADPGARLAAAPPAPPQRAPDGPDIVVTGEQPDIVVTGNAPTMRGGLWRFRRSATLLLGGGGIGAQPMNFTQCLPAGAIEAMLRRAASETSAMPMGDHCNRMKLAFGNGRIDGRRSCSNSRPPPNSLSTSSSSTSRLTLTGQYDERRIRLIYAVEMDQAGPDPIGAGVNSPRQSGARWQITATREGECPLRERRDQIDVNEAVQALFGVGGGTELPSPFED